MIADAIDFVRRLSPRAMRLLRHRLSSRSSPWQIRRVDDSPIVAAPHILYLVGGSVDDPYCIALRCPCGCKALIELPARGGGPDRWRVEGHADHTVSISPSISRTVGCRSHFYLRHGQVVWVLLTARN